MEMTLTSINVIWSVLSGNRTLEGEKTVYLGIAAFTDLGTAWLAKSLSSFRCVGDYWG